MTKQKVQHNVLYSQEYNDEEFKFKDKLVNTIAALTKYLKLIPEEHRAEAICEIDSETEYDSHCAAITIYYWRDETDGEYEVRSNSEKAYYQRKEERERREYEILKKKFEGK